MRALVLALCLLSLPALAHDEGPGAWINKNGMRNSAGEPCCGPSDCFVLPARQVSARADGYHIWVDQVVDGKQQRKFETVPYSESQPSEDGQYWRCRRPDGSRRCFLAPPTNT